MTIKKDHYKMSLVQGENGKLAVRIQIFSPYLNQIIMTCYVEEPRDTKKVCEQFFSEMSIGAPIMEVLEALDRTTEFVADIMRMTSEYRDIVY